MLPLLRKAPKAVRYQRLSRRNLQTNSPWWQSQRAPLTTAVSLRISRQGLGHSRLVYRIGDTLSRYPSAAAFGTETDHDGEEEDHDTAISGPSEEMTAQKDEILKGFLQDLSTIREEVFYVVDDETEQKQEERDVFDVLLEHNLRQRFEVSLARRNFRIQPRGGNDASMLSSFDSGASSGLNEASPSTEDSSNDDNLFSGPTKESASLFESPSDSRSASHVESPKDFTDTSSSSSHVDPPKDFIDTSSSSSEGKVPWYLNPVFRSKPTAGTAKEEVVDALCSVVPESEENSGLASDGTLFSDAPERSRLTQNDASFDATLETGSSDPLFVTAPENTSESTSDWQWDDEGGSTNGGTGTVEERSEIQEELAKVCILLESMTANDWKLFDGESDDVVDDIDLELSDDSNIDEKSDTDDIDQANAELTQTELFRFVLEANLFRSNSLSTDECNLILARVATAPDLFLDAIMDNLLEIYHHMTTFAAPDETTYTILLLTLERRIGGGGSSSDGTIVALLQKMMDAKVKLTSHTLINLGIECLNRENNLTVARRLVIDYALEDEERAFQVPRKATRTLMKMFARENQLEEAIGLLEKCAEKNGLQNSGDTDAVLDAALRWPDRNRAGQRRDITPVLQSFLDVITKDHAGYSPGFSAYRNIIVALSKTTKDDITRWEKLRQPFHALFGNYRTYYPDELLLRVGLNYSEATNDADLARTLVLRSVFQHAPPAGIGSTLASETTNMFSGFPAESSRVISDSAWKSDEPCSSGYDDTGIFSTVMATESNSPAPNSSSEDSLSAMENTESLFSAPPESSALESPPSPFSAAPETSGSENGSDLFSNASESSESESGSANLISALQDLSGMGVGTADGDNAAASELDPLLSATVDDQFGVSQAIAQAKAPPFSFKVFQKALKVCLAADDLQSSRDILDAYSCMRDLYPKSVECDIWSFVVRGFASLGHSPDAIKAVFETMKLKEMKISEETYGAVIHSLAAGKRHDEASELFHDLQALSQDTGVAPGVSCYNAMIFSHINAKDWSQVLCTYDEMKASSLDPNAATTQGLFIASYRVGGTDQARSVMEDVLSRNVVISRDNCRLALKLLMPDILRGNRKASVTEIQSHLRHMGAADESLRPACLNLLRSIRQADIEQNRLPTKNAPLEVLSKRREQAWQAALKDILELEQARRNQNRKKKLELASCA